VKDKEHKAANGDFCWFRMVGSGSVYDRDIYAAVEA